VLPSLAYTFLTYSFPRDFIKNQLTYRQILTEIQAKSEFSSQQIQVVKAQLQAKNREQRMLQLTASEVGILPRETHVYEGVGKM
jgi:hypothetical protein